MFTSQDIICSYTRKQAIEDGDQMLLEGEHAQMARQVGYRYPVYLAHGVISLIEVAVNNPKWCNDWNGVLWDILWMSKVASAKVNEQTRVFTVIITGTGKKRHHHLWIECGPTDIDDPAPCLTIMTREDM